MKTSHFENYRQMCLALESYLGHTFEVIYSTLPGDPSMITGCVVAEKQEGTIIERMTISLPCRKPLPMSVDGVSVCPQGEERYEAFNPAHRPGYELVQYDYRDPVGRLFTSVAPTLERCRIKRDVWLRNLSNVA